MNEPMMDNMVRRLDRLERENRRLKRIGALVLVGIAAAVVMGQARPNKVAKVIEAEKFVLRDASGMARAVLWTGEVEGVPSVGLDLFDKNGKNRLTLAVSEWPFLYLYDNEENLRAFLSLGRESFPRLGLVHEERKRGALLNDKKGSRLMLAVHDEGSFLRLHGPDGKRDVLLAASRDKTALRFYDNNEKVRAGLIMSNDGSTTGLDLIDKDGNLGASVTDRGDFWGRRLWILDKKGKNTRVELDRSALRFYDKDQNQAFTLGMADDQPALLLIDKYARTRAILGLKKGAPLWAMFDEKGQVIWNAP